MRFLVDPCAGRRLAEWLRAQGHDASESRTLGPDPGDPGLLAWAAAERRILITIDTDFGKLLFVDEAASCGLVRLPDVPADKRVELMAEVPRPTLGGPKRERLSPFAENESASPSRRDRRQGE